MTERWRPIPEFGGKYEVSTHGRVRRLYYRQRKGNPASKLLRPGANSSGHLFVYLGRGRKRYVHRLVLTAFRGACPPGKESLHRDGVPANNYLRNLRWGTRSENLLDDYRRHGKRRRR